MLKLLAVLTLLFVSINSSHAKTETAFFSGGDFKWLEADFAQFPGVLLTVNGFIKDSDSKKFSNSKPLYAIKVVYNPLKINYLQLLDYFWHHINPVDSKGQICDVGEEYRSAIFYTSVQQKKQALHSKITIEKKFKAIHTLVLPLKQFYAADDEHQGYYQNHYISYKFLRFYCGRDRILAKIWQ